MRDGEEERVDKRFCGMETHVVLSVRGVGGFFRESCDTPVQKVLYSSVSGLARL
jgi:hypothetical protein